MKKTLLFAIPAFTFMFGCNAGETPVEKVQMGAGTPKQEGVTGAVQSNPNLPPAAKNAILGGGKK